MVVERERKTKLQKPSILCDVMIHHSKQERRYNTEWVGIVFNKKRPQVLYYIFSYLYLYNSCNILFLSPFITFLNSNKTNIQKMFSNEFTQHFSLQLKVAMSLY